MAFSVRRSCIPKRRYRFGYPVSAGTATFTWIRCRISMCPGGIWIESIFPADFRLNLPPHLPRPLLWRFICFPMALRWFGRLRSWFSPVALGFHANRSTLNSTWLRPGRRNVTPTAPSGDVPYPFSGQSATIYTRQYRSCFYSGRNAFPQGKMRAFKLPNRLLCPRFYSAETTRDFRLSKKLFLTHITQPDGVGQMLL